MKNIPVVSVGSSSVKFQVIGVECGKPPRAVATSLD
jgi:hypothetical protein